MPPKIDPKELNRNKPVYTEPTETTPPTAAYGLGATVVELAFNASRDKIREMTIIDRVQGRLLPQLDIVSIQWQYVIEIALYRQDSLEYARLFSKDGKVKLRPVPPDLHDEFMYRTAQWQKSVQGENLKRATDIALAETETRTNDDDFEDGAADKYFKE